MEKAQILSCLKMLGERLESDVEITIGGGAALILAHGLDRPTADIDAIISTPPFDQTLRRAIEAIADEQELPYEWLNDAAKAFTDVLGEGYSGRRVFLSTFGKLTVHALGRQDLVLMKLYSMRAEDIDDLRALSPTTEEIEYVRSQLPRIAEFNDKVALSVDLYLRQGTPQ